MPKPIYCVGGAAIERKLQAKTTLTLATSNPIAASVSYGGVARNVAQNLSHWTSNVYLQTLVGPDPAGRELLSYINKCGVNIRSCSTISHHKTAEYTAICQANGDLFIALADMEIFDAFSEQQLTAWNEWQDQAIVFLDTNIPSAIIPAAIAKAASKNMLLCIDPVSIFKAQRLPQSLEHVYLLKPNKSEAEVLTNTMINNVNDAYKAGKLLLERGALNVVISLGQEGYAVVTPQFQQYVPIQQQLTIVDVNGAGDAFISGILFGLQQGADVIESCQLGLKAATLIIQCKESALSA